MAIGAQQASHRPLLKIKLAGDGDVERLAAVRQAAPRSTLIVDANEAWSEALLPACLAAAEKAGVALIEQPLPATRDEALRGLVSPILICADEKRA